MILLRWQGRRADCKSAQGNYAPPRPQASWCSCGCGWVIASIITILIVIIVIILTCYLQLCQEKLQDSNKLPPLRWVPLGLFMHGVLLRRYHHHHHHPHNHHHRHNHHNTGVIITAIARIIIIIGICEKPSTVLLWRCCQAGTQLSQSHNFFPKHRHRHCPC